MAFSFWFFRAYSINEYKVSHFMTFQMVWLLCVDERVLSTYLLNVALFHPHMFEASRENTHCWEVIYTCSAWDKTFTPSNGLLCHKRTHSGKRPLSCSKCDKSFTMLNILKPDERTGTGEKSFNCSACDKTFTSSNGSWPFRWVLCVDERMILG